MTTNFINSHPERSENPTAHITEMEAPFRVSTFFINNTPNDVTVVFRNNLPHTFEKNPNTPAFRNKTSKSFVVRTIYSFRGTLNITKTINRIQEFRKMSTIDNGELEIIHDTLMTAFNASRNCTNVSVAIDRYIETSVFDNHNSVYLTDVDLLLQKGIYDPNVVHPFSTDGVVLDKYKHQLSDQLVSGVFVELIDNDNSITNRYIYLAKQLFSVPTKKDKARRDGVYFTNVNYNNLGELSIEPQHLSFEAAEEKIGLYKTQEEAVTHGNPELACKAEWEQKQKELLDAKRELELLRNDLKIKEMNRQEELDKLKHEQELNNAAMKEKMVKLEEKAAKRKRKYDELKEKMEQKRDERKDHYEEKSQTRKNVLELIKYVPVVLLAVLTAYNYSKKA
jgi:hypothetical protein